MLKKIIFLICLPFFAFSQNQADSISLDLLNAPASPAFNLLGVAQNDIQRPTDLTAFAFSVKNASNNFTAFPSNYAAEFAPGWLGRKPNLTLDKFNSKSFNDVFWQSFSLSFGFSRQDLEDKETDDSTAFTKTAIGLKFSLLRPTWTGETNKLYDEMVKLQSEIFRLATEVRRTIQASDQQLRQLNTDRVNLANDMSIDRLLKPQLIKQLDSAITARKQVLNDSLDAKIREENEDYKMLTEKAAAFKIERIGPFLDFAGGMVVDFPDNRFDNSSVGKAGAWLTGGYEGGNKNLSVLGIVRYLFQPDKIFADDAGILQVDNIATLDGGARLVFKGAKGRFNTGAEAIYRSVLNENTIDPSWRLVFTAEYDVGLNKKLTFAFGRNFDKTISKSGNLVTAVNFIAGFGNRRKLNTPQ